MNDQTKELLWVCAFRYCLGRRTSAPSDFVAAAIEHWGGIPRNAQCIISKELNRAFEKDDETRASGAAYHPLGDSCDRAEWQKLRNVLAGKGIHDH